MLGYCAGVSLYRPGQWIEFTVILLMRYGTCCLYIIVWSRFCPIYMVGLSRTGYMKGVTDLAGYSLGRSDLVRRAMGKKSLM